MSPRVDEAGGTQGEKARSQVFSRVYRLKGSLDGDIKMPSESPKNGKEDQRSAENK